MSGMELKQNLKLTQQLVMTPRLQLAIKMLALNNIELSEMVKQEIAENPVIDMDGTMENISGQENAEEGNISDIQAESGEIRDDVPEPDPSYMDDMLKYLANYNEQLSDLSLYSEGNITNDKDYIIENSVFLTKTLYESIMEQVMMGEFSSPEINMARFIAGNLDSNGFLAVSGKELLEFAFVVLNNEPGFDGNTGNKTAMEFIEAVLYKFGRLEPVGLAAENAASSLLIQADYYFPEDGLLKVIIEKHLKDVANQNYRKISRETKRGNSRIMESVERLKKLSPHPAANFGQSEARFIIPDLYLKKIKGKYIVSMDDDYIPQIKINSYYRKVLNGEVSAGSTMKNYVEERFKSALWLIKSIDTRKETILKIAQSVVDKQTLFFDKGSGYLKPLILKDIATELGIHESTVSRATSNKYISTHMGVLELKSFFSGTSYGDTSSDSVMASIKKIIEREKIEGTVYCDNEIVNILKKDGISIARRTVAKYREIMNIPSSTRRKF